MSQEPPTCAQCVTLCYSVHSVLQGFTVCTVCYGVLQCLKVCYSVPQCLKVCYSVSQCVTLCQRVSKCVTVCHSVHSVTIFFVFMLLHNIRLAKVFIFDKNGCQHFKLSVKIFTKTFFLHNLFNPNMDVYLISSTRPI